MHIASRMPPYILFVHKIFACPDVHLYVLVHSNVRIECMQSKADDRWFFLLVHDEIDCIFFQLIVFFGICVRPHINIHNDVYANTCAISHGKQSCTWRLGEFLSDCSLKNYCKSCHNAGEGEYWNKFTVGNITSPLLRHCSLFYD